MIGIIGAMNSELELIKKQVHNLEEITTKVRTFYKGTIHNKEVVVVLAGIGKVNAAITTSLLIENFPVEAIINIGVAGGQKGVKHKDVVISDYVLYHDVDVTNFGSYKHGQVPGHDPLFEADQNLLNKTKTILDSLELSYTIGKVASGDQFVYSSENLKPINKEFNEIYAIEMEAGAIAQTASIYEVPFIVYRSISDVIDDDDQASDFNEFVKEAADNAAEVLVKLIEVL